MANYPSTANYEEKYEETELLGEGGFGKVFKVKQRLGDEVFASKHIKTVKKKQRENAKAEIELLKTMSSPFVITFVEAFESDKKVIMITEYLDGGELFERVVDEDFQLMESECCLFTKQICRGLQYLHSNAIVHLDIKPENIVITEKGGKNIKIIDLGTALRLSSSEKVQAMVGTAEFVAPEVVNYDDISMKTDQWSLGVLTFILLSGASPFLSDDEDDQKTLNSVAMAKYDFDYEEFDIVSSDAKDFISRLLRKRSENRMSSSECLEHSWLEEKEIGNKTAKIKIENLRIFLARRKLKNVGRVLRAINVFKETARDSRSRSKETSSGDSGEED